MAFVHAAFISAFQLCHLQAGHVVQHLRYKRVTAFAGCIAAQHIRTPRLRHPVDLNGAFVVRFPLDVPNGQAIIAEAERADSNRPDLLFQLALQPFGVEEGLANNAPHAQGVNCVEIRVGLFELFQNLPVRFRQIRIVLVGAFVYPNVRIFPVEEPLFQPVGNAHRVEGDDDLLVVIALVAQSDVQLVKIVFQNLGGFFHPYAGNAPDGFQFLHVIQPREQDL